MNKTFKISGAFFLIYVLILIGCGSSTTKWSNLYQTDGDHTAALEGAADVTIDDETKSTQEEASETDDIDKNIEKKTTVWVYICGAVESPGVYELPEGSRVIQAIEAAGGLREDADSLLINQASIVEDGEQIRIYTKEEAEEADSVIDTKEGVSADGKVNLNRADAVELMTLPGIGEAKADAIISYREEHGDYKSIEDIMNIPGIKEAVFSKIKDKITV